MSLPPAADDVARYIQSMRLDTTERNKRRFLERNDREINRLIAWVNKEVVAEHGNGGRPSTREDFWVIFNCEADLVDQSHDADEKGILPLPSVIRSWNGPSAPAWDRPMAPEVNLFHYALYIAEIKNKPRMDGTNLFVDVFQTAGISGNRVREAKVVAGVVHGYFSRSGYTGARPERRALVDAYLHDTSIVDMLRGSTFKKLAALSGRETNVGDALEWVRSTQTHEQRVVTRTTYLLRAPDPNAPGTLLHRGTIVFLVGNETNGFNEVEANDRQGFVRADALGPDGAV